VRLRVKAPAATRAAVGSDDDKGSDYAKSGSDDDDDDDDDDDGEASDYEAEDGDEVAAAKATAKAAPARARRARNPAAGARTPLRPRRCGAVVSDVLPRCAAGKKSAAEQKKAAKAAAGRPAPPSGRRRRHFGEEELPDDYDDLEDELEDMPEGALLRSASRGATLATLTLSRRLLLLCERLWRL